LQKEYLVASFRLRKGLLSPLSPCGSKSGDGEMGIKRTIAERGTSQGPQENGIPLKRQRDASDVDDNPRQAKSQKQGKVTMCAHCGRYVFMLMVYSVRRHTLHVLPRSRQRRKYIRA
jgi:hypothetical protein